ncbi:MAG: heme-binding protein [Gammaproteobacteria bacterium]|jgi:uncharacterized protein GlcG (DUF336 family)
MKAVTATAIFLLAAASPPSHADDLISVKQISAELASDLAWEAVRACRAKGYQVSAVVVDRSASPQVVIRDTLAPRFTIQIATEKANAVILSRVSSSEFRRNREDIRMEMNHVDGLLVLEGGLPISAAGSMVGAIGVSGAPGGDKDAECAMEALEKIEARLEFAE